MTADVEALRRLYNEAVDRRHRELLRAEVERRTAEDPNFDPLCRSHREFWHTSLAEACDAGLRAVAEAAVRDDWENPETDSPWLAMAARNADERNRMRERAERAEAEVERLTAFLDESQASGRRLLDMLNSEIGERAKHQDEVERLRGVLEFIAEQAADRDDARYHAEKALKGRAG